MGVIGLSLRHSWLLMSLCDNRGKWLLKDHKTKITKQIIGMTLPNQQIHERQYPNSYYAATANRKIPAPMLQGERQTDVCVIGGGITGCSTALHLAERGYKVCVLEANEIGWGASGRNGGQMLNGYSSGQATLEKLLGKDDACKLWEMSLDAVALVKSQVAKHNIQCDLKQGHLLTAIKPRHADELRHNIDQMQQLYDYELIEYLDAAEVKNQVGTDRYIAGSYDPGCGHLHPLNYTLGLANAAQLAGAEFYAQTAAASFTKSSEGYAVTGGQGTIKSRYVVFCCNAYIHKLESRLRSKIMPVGTYIIATEPLGEARARGLIQNDCSVADTQFVLDYYRMSADHRMLFGGGVSYSTLPPPKLTENMRKRMLTVFPQLTATKIEYTWGGFVGITMNRAPHFGRLENNVYFAQGFSGHGVALTGFAGKLMADAIAGTAEQFDLFAKIPHKSFPGGKALRTPSLVLAMFYYRMRDLL